MKQVLGIYVPPYFFLRTLGGSAYFHFTDEET